MIIDTKKVENLKKTAKMAQTFLKDKNAPNYFTVSFILQTLIDEINELTF